MPKKNWSLIGTEWTVSGLRGTTQVDATDMRQMTRESVCCVPSQGNCIISSMQCRPVGGLEVGT